VDGKVAVFGPSFAMLKSTPEEELATWLLIKWLLEPENQARWIRASDHLPSRASAAEALTDYAEQHPQWEEALALLQLAQPEPGHASWGVVRWALSDAAEQLFRLGLTSEQVPALLEELEDTAAEMHARSR
jgi:ABC-type glycerol-3-phosphate transport system substrate-binding protein